MYHKNTNVMSIIRDVLRYFIKIYDNIFSKETFCSIGDVILKRGTANSHQFLLTTRLLDIEYYKNNNDKSFPFQTTISKKAYGESYNVAAHNKAFIELISSYEFL